MLTRQPSSDQLALSSVFLRQARADDAGRGYCAKGVANLLEHVGLGCQRGDAYTWKSSLPQNGWIKLEGVTPENAPPGAVLVFDRDAAGQRGESGGTRYGHVEIVTVDTAGKRQYVSDAARTNWGGTVPQNFVGVYVHPSLHKTNDGINYVPNLEGRGNTVTASAQNGSRSREGNSGATGYDPTFLALLNNNNANSGDASASGSAVSNTDNFNNQADMNAFLVLAVVVSALYGIQMDTGAKGPQQETAPTEPIQGAASPVAAG